MVMHIATRRVLLNSARAIPAFHPTDLTGLVALYDISDLSTLKVERTGASATTPSSVDGVVGTDLDLSGNAYHMAAGSDAARPLLKTSGGLYWLQPDGVDDYLKSSSTASPGNDVTMMVAFRAPSTAPNYTTLFGMVTTNFTNVATFVFAKKDAANQYGLWADGDFRLGATYTAGTDYVVEFVKSGTTITRRINGASEATYTGTNRSISGPPRFSEASPFSNNARFYGAMIVSRALVGAELTNSRAFWAQRAGVTL